jgi:long-chain acyl-CoA synthetase
VLYRHPKVAEAVTVGVPDAYREEDGQSFHRLETRGKGKGSRYHQFSKEKRAPYKVPKLVEFRESIPKSVVGKIPRKILREVEIAKNKK